MTLHDLRTAIIAALAAGFPAGTAVDEYGGRLTPEEIKRIAAQAPAVKVAILGVDEAKDTPSGRVEVTAVCGAFLITKSKPGSPRDAAALILVSGALALIPGNLWGLEDTQIPQAVRAQNLFSGELDKTAVALWGITWRQEISVGGIDEATLDDFITFHATWDMAPPDAQTDAEDNLTDLDQ